MPIEKIGVVGCGLMGSGIAQTAAQAGLQVTVREVSTELLDKGFANMDKSLARLIQRGTLTAVDRDSARARLRGTTKLEELAGCDFIIEAITEQLAAKKEAFAVLDKVCPPQTIYASNTSSLSITEMAVATRRPERFVGLHFFNPVPIMKLAEVIRTIATDPKVYEEVVAFAGRLGKMAVRTSDRTGFVVNRLLVPYLLDAVRALEEGVASIPDIDLAMKLGTNYPFGPFEWCERIGIRNVYELLKAVYDDTKDDRYKISSRLEMEASLIHAKAQSR